MFERVTNKLPLYLALAVPAAAVSVWVVGPVGGGIIATVANLVLWHLLLRPSGEEDLSEE